MEYLPSVLLKDISTYFVPIIALFIVPALRYIEEKHWSPLAKKKNI